MYRWARLGAAGAAGAGATAAALCIPTTSSVSSTAADLETTPSRTAVRHGQGQGQVQQAGQQAPPRTPHRWFPRLRYGWAVAACDAADGSAAAVEPIELTRVDTELPRWAGPKPRPGEAQYTRATVSANDGTEGKPLWVTYRDGVYDITEFQHEHPGGNFITQAAGGAVDSFWQQWAYHHLSPKVVEALELLRIGALTDWTADDDCLDDGGQYTDEPHASRGTGQDVLFPQPFCSQSTPETLGSSYLTPNDDFYVRNHAPVPVTLPADLHEYELTFNRSPRAGNGPTTEVLRAPLEFICGLFPAVTVTSIVQCTGNRAAEAIAAHPDKESGFKETPFEDIGFGMLGNAQWSGARLSEVLSALYPGLATEDHANLHVQFGGEDGYSCSVPLATVMDPTRDCILATRMNGKPLPLDHGYPVRALLPGVVGARNVKWVSSITIQNSECDSPWQALYYKVGPENEKVSAHHLPLQALTTSPPQGSAAPTPGAPLAANGVAFSGGSGNRIRAVQLSLDGGVNWVDAEVHRAEVLADSSSRAYGWVRWSATLQTPAGGAAALVCRAVDDEGNASPAVGVPGGYLYDGYHTVRFAPGPAVDMPEAAEALQDAAQ